jgi:dynein heavy chain
MQKLDIEREQFTKSLELYKEQFNKIKTFSDLAAIDEFHGDSGTLKADLEEASAKVDEFNRREKLFNIQTTTYQSLDTLQAEFKPFQELIEMAYDKKLDFKDWQTSAFFQQNPAEITSSVTKWHQLSFRLYKALEADFPDTAAVAQELRNEIEEFQKYTPLITNLLQPANSQEEWEEIKAVLPNLPENFGNPEENINLKQILEMGAMEHIEEIETICHKAEKKYQLGEQLKKMRDEMKQTTLTTAAYKGLTFVLKYYDDINGVLDEQNVQTQAIMSSQYCSGHKLKSETSGWDKKLNEMSEIIEEISKCQRTWMYLEPIFSSPDIHTQMPAEGQAFSDVDTLWKATMDFIEADPCIMQLLEQEGLKGQFQTANRKLEEIQSKLNDYLEEKRQVFSRFYFLANEDLLMLLAQTKEPRAV